MYPTARQDNQTSRGCHTDHLLIEDVQQHVSAARMQERVVTLVQTIRQQQDGCECQWRRRGGGSGCGQWLCDGRYQYHQRHVIQLQTNLYEPIWYHENEWGLLQELDPPQIRRLRIYHWIELVETAWSFFSSNVDAPIVFFGAKGDR